MTNALKDIYYDPSRGFVSLDKLWRRAKEVDPTIKHSEVKEFLQSQPTWQINKRSKKPTSYRSVTAPYPGFSFQMDLMVYSRFKIHNYQYLLTCIDVNSRFAQARALTNREAPTILRAIKEIFGVMGVPKNLNTDNEFVQSAKIRDYLLGQGITMYVSDPDELHKNAIVERFHLTLATMLQKWRTSKPGLRDWTKVLQPMIDNYNTSVHSSIKERPVDVFERRVMSKQRGTISVTQNFSVGDKVRTKVLKQAFDKSDVISYSREIYVIIEIRGQRYLLRNLRTGVEPKRRYKAYELIAASVPEIEETVPEPVRPKVTAPRKREVQALNAQKDWYVGFPLEKTRARKAIKKLNL